MSYWFSFHLFCPGMFLREVVKSTTAMWICVFAFSTVSVLTLCILKLFFRYIYSWDFYIFLVNWLLLLYNIFPCFWFISPLWICIIILSEFIYNICIICIYIHIISKIYLDYLFFIHSDNPWILVDLFRTFTFNIITDIWNCAYHCVTCLLSLLFVFYSFDSPFLPSFGLIKHFLVEKSLGFAVAIS